MARPAAEIWACVWLAFFRPLSWMKELSTLWVWTILLLRCGMALFTLPLVLISGMLSDSGTQTAQNIAMLVMYAMFLILLALFLLSWRCATAGGLIILSYVGSTVALDSEDTTKNAFICVLLKIFAVVVTEAFPAPIRTSIRFYNWVVDENENYTEGDTPDSQGLGLSFLAEKNSNHESAV